MITFPYNRKPLCRKLSAFTLVELIISASLGSIILAGVLTTFTLYVKSGIRAANYSIIEEQTRRAFTQLGIDARMANGYGSDFTSGVIKSFTLQIPNSANTDLTFMTYGYDGSGKFTFFSVPGTDPTATAGRLNLISNITAVTIYRYNAAGTEIPAATTSDAGIKHIQISVSVSRSQSGVAAATQVIRSSAFTMRNIAY